VDDRIRYFGQPENFVDLSLRLNFCDSPRRHATGFETGSMDSPGTGGVATRSHRSRDELAEIFLFGALVQKPVSDERNQI